VRHLVEYAAARFVVATLEWSPLPIANALSRLYARLLDLLIPRLRRVAHRNIAIAGIAADPSNLTDGVYRSVARLLVGIARFPGINRNNVADWIRYDGLEHFTEAKRRGKGVLFATAHFGNWELSAFAHGLMTEPMHVVVRPLDNPFIDRLVESRRRLSGNQIIEKKDAARAIFRALARNEAVGVLIDQNVGLDEGVFIPFFGIPACVGTAFARIANRTGAAVIPGYAIWSEQEKRYILRFEPIVDMTGDEVKDTATIHARLEAAIRGNPDQWLWIHRRWKTRPHGELPLY
jgi:Kdo2-lipid IVA lauroyltransferase/acyltransferase